MSLGPDARSLIDAARGCDDPSFDDVARVRSKIAARLAVSVAAGAAAFLSAKPAAAALTTTAASMGFATKVVVAVALVTGVATTTVVVTRAPEPPPAQRASPPALVAPALAKAVAPVVAPREQAPSVEEEPAAEAPKPRTASTFASAPARASASAPASVDRVAQEASMMRQANVALTQSDPERALALLSDHARRHPNGALAEERRGLRVLALCAAGRRDEGRAEASAFLASSPRSPLAARVRTACE